MTWLLYYLTHGPPRIRPPSAPIEPMNAKPTPAPNVPAEIDDVLLSASQNDLHESILCRTNAQWHYLALSMSSASIELLSYRQLTCQLQRLQMCLASRLQRFAAGARRECRM